MACRALTHLFVSAAIPTDPQVASTLPLRQGRAATRSTNTWRFCPSCSFSTRLLENCTSKYGEVLFDQRCSWTSLNAARHISQSTYDSLSRFWVFFWRLSLKD